MTVKALRKALRGVDGSLRVEMADAESVVFAQVVNNTIHDWGATPGVAHPWSVFVISDHDGSEEKYQDEEDYTEAT
jgi:hypothetical protein